jgi:hypothetical protein
MTLELPFLSVPFLRGKLIVEKATVVITVAKLFINVLFCSTCYIRRFESTATGSPSVFFLKPVYNAMLMLAKLGDQHFSGSVLHQPDCW